MNQNYTTSFTVDQTPEEAFAAINNVRGWWSQAIEGDTDKLDAVVYLPLPRPSSLHIQDHRIHAWQESRLARSGKLLSLY